MNPDLEPWEIPMIHLNEGRCPICNAKLLRLHPEPPYEQAGICPRCEARFRWNPSYEPQEIAS